MLAPFLVAFVVITVVQSVAILAGLGVWFDVGGVAARLIALAVALVPFFGASFGIIAAIDIWGWGFLPPILLFGGAQVLLLAMICKILRVAERQEAKTRR
ncbi:MAG: hypothetical protein EA356_07395 [Geminicoccaceae bacterium]|nr:MAG: hypothetical protein EA356_07395 [Geminicoccaceae bacterium]